MIYAFSTDDAVWPTGPKAGYRLISLTSYWGGDGSLEDVVWETRQDARTGLLEYHKFLKYCCLQQQHYYLFAIDADWAVCQDTVLLPTYKGLFHSGEPEPRPACDAAGTLCRVLPRSAWGRLVGTVDISSLTPAPVPATNKTS